MLQRRSLLGSQERTWLNQRDPECAHTARLSQPGAPSGTQALCQAALRGWRLAHSEANRQPVQLWWQRPSVGRAFLPAPLHSAPVEASRAAPWSPAAEGLEHRPLSPAPTSPPQQSRKGCATCVPDEVVQKPSWPQLTAALQEGSWSPSRASGCPSILKEGGASAAAEAPPPSVLLTRDGSSPSKPPPPPGPGTEP